MVRPRFIERLESPHGRIARCSRRPHAPNHWAGGWSENRWLEVVEESGDRFVIALSGEGLKGLAADIQAFLDEDPELAEIKSPPRQ